MTLPARVQIVEVGPRDGLQNEMAVTPVAVRTQLIELLARAGLNRIEVGSFVSEKAVPQMAGTAEVLASIRVPKGVNLSALVPNMQGFAAATAAGVGDIALFAAASESFSRKNLGCGVDESFNRFARVAAAAKDAGLAMRGYVSCALGCPYEGKVDHTRVVETAQRLLALGCYEISLADTIGVGTPVAARELIQRVAQVISVERIAVHFHDTYGQALANIFACLEHGVSVVDSSVAGLGGCPFAPGAAGNVATEDVVYMLNGCDVETGVDLGKLLDATRFICASLDRPPESKVARARLAGESLPSQRCATNSE
ncbi:hydroxymethylglutaryl-CoA lyase [Methylocystis sp. MJC1]|uniref:hydroxymethylglutaryl-CoA lyase n=1 Tax=Methylocystis sp. MJC1 TaxID=2654282 RepID=UPI0013EC24E9|nr:hydroxymethylglutaryl-CoA lyase [Methylocystis sp. MJC1]KAF2989841.1 3-hydroxy-3-isohexenylglutaryl-CoA/hydroxy-methylglutaryl-CoA lyase [Methylocystis sp. MJC1]MBU6528392.1 hydroxymethylglutaryl-CoA lyase [Methylocystis sp. MJC1]UZX11294.1 hydroxymethylglutaryl-CoA lyase [Methylocystis sp. MJC1]